jgi:hypothetical protein
VPGHPDELEGAFVSALRDDTRVYIRMSEERNARAVDGEGLVVLREGRRGPLVVAVGPTLDPVLAATADIDATVAYLSIVRPFDVAGLRRALTGTDVVLVEPYQAGTSSAAVAAALADRPFRLLVSAWATPNFGGTARLRSIALHTGWTRPGSGLPSRTGRQLRSRPSPRSGGLYAEAPAYISEPGVVSCSPVSSSVFRPERIIGQPP